MATVSGRLLPVGTRYVNVFSLNAKGHPAAVSPATSYTGVQAEGGKQLNMTVPEPRKITHAGDDRPLAIDFLPALEAASGELHIAKTNYALQALVAGVLVSTIGESEGMLYATNQQGFEPDVALQIYQQALDASGAAGISGARRWRNIWIPKARLILMPHGTDDNAADLVYKIAPFIVGSHLWGTQFTTILDGAVESQFSERMTEGIEFLDSYLADGLTSVFALTHSALSTAKISVFLDGVLRTTNMTLTVNSVTFTSLTPGSGVDISILSEY